MYLIIQFYRLVVVHDGSQVVATGKCFISYFCLATYDDETQSCAVEESLVFHFTDASGQVDSLDTVAADEGVLDEFGNTSVETNCGNVVAAGESSTCDGFDIVGHYIFT